jgi:adenosylcobinamide-phosphate synthase
MFSLVVVTLFAVPAYFLLSYLRGVNFVAFIVVAALFLKLTFSFKGLRKAALKVKSLLLDEKLDEARFELRALVGRDVKTLSKPFLVSATVESVAENSCDSFVAPLFYFLIFGVPGAIAYRAVNTLDSRIGYHGRYEYLGKFASRLDDVLNYIPARLTAILLVLAAFLSRNSGRKSWQVALSDHSKTESPNAGWPMAATAGALNIQLEKVDYYKLGNANATLAPEAIDNSLSLTRIALVLWISVCYTIGGIYLAYST